MEKNRQALPSVHHRCRSGCAAICPDAVLGGGQQALDGVLQSSTSASLRSRVSDGLGCLMVPGDHSHGGVKITSPTGVLKVLWRPSSLAEGSRKGLQGSV
jgi:hypothetical protein